MGVSDVSDRRTALRAIAAGVCAAAAPALARAETESVERLTAKRGPARAKPVAAPPITSAAGRGRSQFRAFENSPFPYNGDIPEQNKPFLDVSNGSRRGHTSPRGGVVWQDKSYTDQTSLLYIPEGFDPGRPAVMVVYFHGNQVILKRDVVARQRVPAQLERSGLNAVLVAPQFAVNVLDSSAGRFWQPGVFAHYLEEAGAYLSELHGDPASQSAFNDMPVVLAAYSGGYLPAAFALKVGGADRRIRGVLMLDAIYAETEKFADWIAGHQRETFFVSAYSGSTRAENLRLSKMLDERRIPYLRDLPATFGPGTVAIFSAGDVPHNDFVTRAWTSDPLSALLARASADPSGTSLRPKRG